MSPPKNYDELIQFLKGVISKNRKIGESAGGTEHLSYTSIVDIKPEEPKPIKFRGKNAFEIRFMVETYTETEFMHGPEDDVYFRHRYNDAVVYTSDFQVLEYRKDV